MPVIDKPGTVWLQGVKELAQLWNQIEGVTSVYAYAPGPFQKANPPSISLSNIGVIIPCLVGNQFQRVVLAVTGSDIESRVKREALEVPQAVGLVIGTKTPPPHRQPSTPIPRAEPPPESADNVDVRTDAELDAELARLRGEFADHDPDQDTNTPAPPKPSPKGDPVAAKKKSPRNTGSINYEAALAHLLTQGKGATFELVSPRDIMRDQGVAENKLTLFMVHLQSDGFLSKRHLNPSGEGTSYTVTREPVKRAASASKSSKKADHKKSAKPAHQKEKTQAQAHTRVTSVDNPALIKRLSGDIALMIQGANGALARGASFHIKGQTLTVRLEHKGEDGEKISWEKPIPLK
jgi:hypothetical protein